MAKKIIVLFKEEGRMNAKHPDTNRGLTGWDLAGGCLVVEEAASNGPLLHIYPLADILKIYVE